MSEWGCKMHPMETEYTVDYVKSLATEVSDDKNMAASISKVHIELME